MRKYVVDIGLKGPNQYSYAAIKTQRQETVLAKTPEAAYADVESRLVKFPTPTSSSPPTSLGAIMDAELRKGEEVILLIVEKIRKGDKKVYLRGSGFMAQKQDPYA